MNKKFTFKIFGSVLALFLLSACASNPEKTSEYSAQDIMFAEMMIPHHEQAIVMSDLALAKSTNPEILELAREIKDAQGPEIEQMKSWEGVDANTHMGHTMMGMLDEEEITNLKTALGKDFDRLFLEGMIKHHEGAIDMAGMIADSKNQEVADLGKAIIATQTSEIKFMQTLLATLKSD
ncbi:MAG: DUF305 domain-containing protein [Candidatus Nanopelagicaceae bacterium]